MNNFPPEGERREDLEGRDRIAGLEHRLQRYARQIALALAVLGVALVVCVALLVSAIRANHEALAKANDERAQRIDETCTISESKQREDVMQLRRTYDYLESLTPAERRTGINRAILATLPVVEQAAETDDAPKYCDEPGAAAEARGAKPIGLPEPDLPVPKRPADLR